MSAEASGPVAAPPRGQTIDPSFTKISEQTSRTMRPGGRWQASGGISPDTCQEKLNGGAPAPFLCFRVRLDAVQGLLRTAAEDEVQKQVGGDLI
jgi:hypothetical protein